MVLNILTSYPVCPYQAENFSCALVDAEGKWLTL